MELLLLFHTTKISANFQGTLHIGNIVQTAVVKKIIDKVRFYFFFADVSIYFILEF